MAKLSASPKRPAVPVGYSRMREAIKKSNFGLSETELTKLCDVLLDEIAKRMESGQRVAFLQTNPDGTVELTVLGLQVLNKKRGTLR